MSCEIINEGKVEFPLAEQIAFLLGLAHLTCVYVRRFAALLNMGV